MAALATMSVFYQVGRGKTMRGEGHALFLSGCFAEAPYT
jgi:hypothetical protein